VARLLRGYRASDNLGCRAQAVFLRIQSDEVQRLGRVLHAWEPAHPSASLTPRGGCALSGPIPDRQNCWPSGWEAVSPAWRRSLLSRQRGSAGGVIRAIWLAIFVQSNRIEVSGEEECQPTCLPARVLLWRSVMPTGANQLPGPTMTRGAPRRVHAFEVDGEMNLSMSLDRTPCTKPQPQRENDEFTKCQ
jgi:hypothetical protein